MAKKKEKGAIAEYLEKSLQVQLHDDGAQTRFPLLCQFLLPVYDGLTLIRQEGSLRIQASGPEWQVSMECPSEQIMTTVALPSLIDLFETLEGLLASHRCVWKPNWKKKRKDLSALSKPL